MRVDFKLWQISPSTVAFENICKQFEEIFSVPPLHILCGKDKLLWCDRFVDTFFFIFKFKVHVNLQVENTEKTNIKRYYKRIQLFSNKNCLKSKTVFDFLYAIAQALLDALQDMSRYKFLRFLFFLPLFSESFNKLNV